MAPASADEEEKFADLFSCGICSDFFFEPVTNSCCGKTFCRRCLRQWIRSSVRTAGIPRCPAGCNQKLPVQLPSTSASLTAAMEQLVPETFARRKQEDAEDDEEEEKTCRGGFTPWQTVAAAQDISFGNMVGVRQGTPGIIICNSTDGHHLTVKFEYREDASDLCVDVLPGHLMLPLPGNFRIGQKVMACIDLHHSVAVRVRVGTPGVVCGPAPHVPDHVHVLFEDPIDPSEGLERYLAVHHTMILPYRLLVGGFSLGQRIQSNRDMIINDRVFVRIGTPGVIIGEYSDTRLTIAFETENQNQEPGYDSHSNFNVLPMDIRVYRETPCDMPLGQIVRAKTDLGSGRSLLVKAGTRGTVIAYIDEWRIIVSFDANEGDGTCQQVLTVTEGALEKVDSEGTTSTDSSSQELP